MKNIVFVLSAAILGCKQIFPPHFSDKQVSAIAKKCVERVVCKNKLARVDSQTLVSRTNKAAFLSKAIVEWQIQNAVHYDAPPNGVRMMDGHIPTLASCGDHLTTKISFSKVSEQFNDEHSADPIVGVSIIRTGSETPASKPWPDCFYFLASGRNAEH